MLQYEGKRVRGPNGEEGVVQNGQIVLSRPAAPPPGLRQVVAAPPKEPMPQTPTQSALDSARLGQVPLENEQKQTSIQSARTSIADTALDNATTIRKQFESMQPVQDYRTVLPQYAAAIEAADNQAGDLQLVYAFGKVMDPGSVVREGEVQMAQGTGGLSERLKGYLSSIQGGARLTPEIRRGLLMEIRNRAHHVASQYNQVREQYKGLAQRSGLNPEDIVGAHPGGPFQQAEADFVKRPITNLDGSQGAVPTGYHVAPLTPSNIVDHFVGDEGGLAVDVTDDRLPGETEEQYQARIAREGTGGQTPPQRGQGGALETVDAGVRGVADVLTIGLADELAAAGDTVFGDGTMRQNLRKQRGIDEYDEQNHFSTRLTGQMVGSLLLPMGKIGSPAQLAAKSGGYGAGYGFGSGEGGIDDRALNALLGAGAGAAGGYALAKTAPLVMNGVGAAGRKIIGPPSPRQNALLQAGTEEGVPLNMSDVFPGTRNTVATLETIPGAAGPVHRGIAAGRDAIEGRVQGLGRGGAPRENMGEAVQEAGKRFVGRANEQASRLYNRARKAAADTPITPQSVMQVLTSLVREEAQTPGGTRAGEVISRYAKAFEEGGPITIDGARRMRSELLSRLRDDGGLSKAQATRITGQIMGGINDDIERSLTAAGRREAVRAYRTADRFYAQSREEIDRTIERFVGTEGNPKSPEQTLSALQNAMGPKGNSPALHGMLRRLSPDERKDFAATLVEPLGRAGADEPFSPGMFLSNIRKLSPAARELTFGRQGEQSIQNLIRLSNAKKATVQSLNNSRSGMTSNYRAVLSTLLFGLPGGGAMAGMATGLNGATGAVGGAAIGGAGLGLSRALAKALMSEKFTRILAEAPATANPREIDAHIGRMRQLAAKDPNVRAAVQNIEQQLLNAVNDNFSVSRVAASDSGAKSERDEQRQ